jgi:hypothetical protein
MSDQHRHFQRYAIPASQAHIADSAERRQRLFDQNEFKIRAIWQEAVKAGAGDDFIVLLLDLNDPIARQIYESRPSDAEEKRIGQPARPEDTLQLLGASYSRFRELFSPNHRNLFDRCRSGDIRAALMSEGRTMAMILPGDAKLKDIAPFIAIQTAEDRKAGTMLPEWILPPMP